MTREDFLRFMDRLFLAFPSVKEYLHFNSSDVSQTMAEWFPILKGLEAPECHALIDGWLSGSVPMFDAKERGYICLIVKSRVLAHRDALKRAKAQAESSAEFRRIRSERLGSGEGIGGAFAKILPMDMLEAISRILPFNKKLENGEITLEEWNQERDRIYLEYCDSFKKKDAA